MTSGSIPIYEPWLADIASESNDPFVRESETWIRHFLELFEVIPRAYGWRRASVEQFSKQTSTVKAVEDFNQIYWQDFARNVEAYAVLSMWRGKALLQPALHFLNERQVISPAVLSRSLLELGASVLANANMIFHNVSKGISQTPSDTLIVSAELEELVVNMIYGTRLETLPSNPKRQDAGQFIKKLTSKVPGLQLVYHYLCEFAHPSLLGYAQFWARIEDSSPLSERLRIEEHAESELTKEARERVMWALGWSAAATRNGVLILQETVRDIVKRWPVQGSGAHVI